MQKCCICCTNFFFLEYHQFAFLESCIVPYICWLFCSHIDKKIASRCQNAAQTWLEMDWSMSVLLATLLHPPQLFLDFASITDPSHFQCDTSVAPEQLRRWPGLHQFISWTLSLHFLQTRPTSSPRYIFSALKKDQWPSPLSVLH